VDDGTAGGMKKRIVIDARESGTGTGRYVDKLLENLNALKPPHHVVVLAKPHRLKAVRKLAPEFEVVETTFAEFGFGEQLGFKRQIEKLMPDLVHFCMVQQPVRYKGTVVTSMLDLTTVRFRNPAKNPAVFWVKQRVYGWLNKRVARKSAHIITISDYVKNDVAAFAGVSTDKITTTYPAADAITDAARGLQRLHGDDFILYVGRALPHKNLDRLLDAFAILKESHPQLKLVLAGRKDALYERLEKRAHDMHLNDVCITGFVTEGQLRWLYEHCQAYVFPSLSEGFGLPPLEAMRHGAPVASSSATCLPEIIGKAAVYFDPQSPEDIAAKVATVLDDKKLRSSLVRAGRQQVKKYSWRHMAEQTLQIYEDAFGLTRT
jgi:glycosyltransferase involved in cell wall biosynthesis